ncbi:hypothetical protein HBN54_002274 [Hymenobacter sp. 1B]|uniref:Uncharacterized protein n=1 Tax=Hymenobacter artigasi TaxID=2719616 RepID=A0ABX1HHK4_9BACT|nr:hypothetical protein [Hymenobacter artigasi]
MAQARYAARFENFFENLRLDHDQFAEMAVATVYGTLSQTSPARLTIRTKPA